MGYYRNRMKIKLNFNFEFFKSKLKSRNKYNFFYEQSLSSILHSINYNSSHRSFNIKEF